MASSMDLDIELKRLKETGSIDGLYGASHVGRVVDIYNNSITKKREKDYANDMEDRNKYFLPLWKRAIEELSNK